jgi:hypothetical protein
MLIKTEKGFIIVTHSQSLPSRAFLKVRESLEFLVRSLSAPSDARTTSPWRAAMPWLHAYLNKKHPSVEAVRKDQCAFLSREGQNANYYIMQINVKRPFPF